MPEAETDRRRIDIDPANPNRIYFAGNIPGRMGFVEVAAVGAATEQAVGQIRYGLGPLPARPTDRYVIRRQEFIAGPSGVVAWPLVAISFPKLMGELASYMPAISPTRAFISGSARLASISLFSLSTISAEVLLGMRKEAAMAAFGESCHDC